MQDPVEVTVESNPELDFPLTYVRYRRLADGDYVSRSERLTDSVTVDFDANENILGIELLGFDEPDLAIACDYARKKSLSFPADLRGTIPSPVR